MIFNTNGASFLGVMVQEIDSQRAQALKLPGEYGVEVTRVEQDSPADHAGLKPGDAIQQYNGQRVEGMEEFKRFVRETPPGREVRLEVIRNGAPQTVAVKMESRKQMSININPDMERQMRDLQKELQSIRVPDIPRTYMAWRSQALGLEVESLDGQLAQYFGVKEGVLVRSVNSGSAAEKAGIKAGDVILKINDTPITKPNELSNRMRSMRGKQVPVTVMRDHKETTLNVTVEEDSRSEWFQAPFVPDAAAFRWVQ